LREFIVMPNHIRGIIGLTENIAGAAASVGAKNFSPQQPAFRPNGMASAIGVLLKFPSVPVLPAMSATASHRGGGVCCPDLCRGFGN
jgi:hypothetical protein